jgi:hypothetical protein
MTKDDAADNWTTRILPEYTRPFGVEQIHEVWFTPNGWPGKGTTISLGIPECELQYVTIGTNGDPVALINRAPPTNRKVRLWIRLACERATADKAALFFSCDTAEQATYAAKLAARWLPSHQRTAIERLYRAADRVKEKLS